ncbi:MAG: MBL fold metallo-hydrolase [Phycisphaerae bacterium]|nr:MBL fold metallo-hydrolase [Phycisphaerae bacterium]
MASTDLTITVLGSGTSHGIPMIACDCPVCGSTDPRDKRTRASVAVTRSSPPPIHPPSSIVNPQSPIDTTLLIDTGPELRLQCLANDIRHVDAVLYTHHHIDHLAGLDDLRRFNWVQNQDLPCYGLPDTLERLRTMFAYVFEHDPEYPSAKPELTTHAINGPFDIPTRPTTRHHESPIVNPQSSIRITPVPLLHGTLPVLGFRIGNFAYCTDVSEIPRASWPLLEGLDVLILAAVRKRPHATHFNLEQAVDHAQRIGAKRTYFTHIAHELAHEETNRDLPANMALAYDGQVIHST